MTVEHDDETVEHDAQSDEEEYSTPTQQSDTEPQQPSDGVCGEEPTTVCDEDDNSMTEEMRMMKAMGLPVSFGKSHSKVSTV